MSFLMLFSAPAAPRKEEFKGAENGIFQWKIPFSAP